MSIKVLTYSLIYLLIINVLSSMSAPVGRIISVYISLWLFLYI